MGSLTEELAKETQSKENQEHRLHTQEKFIPCLTYEKMITVTHELCVYIYMYVQMLVEFCAKRHMLLQLMLDIMCD